MEFQFRWNYRMEFQFRWNYRTECDFFSVRLDFVVLLAIGQNRSHVSPTRAGMVGVRLRVLQAALRQPAAGASKAPAAKKKKGEAKVVPVVAKEIREKVTLGANILKTGSDPPILDDSAHPPWLWGLIDKRPALSELERRDPDTLYEKEIMRLLKLDNRRRIKENNSLRSKG